MKKIRTHTKGDITTNTSHFSKGGSVVDPQGTNHVHYELSPMSKTHGNFDVPTKHKIDAAQRREMDRKL
jgi:hypothetical protein